MLACITWHNLRDCTERLPIEALMEFLVELISDSIPVSLSFFWEKNETCFFQGIPKRKAKHISLSFYAIK